MPPPPAQGPAGTTAYSLCSPRLPTGASQGRRGRGPVSGGPGLSAGAQDRRQERRALRLLPGRRGCGLGSSQCSVPFGCLSLQGHFPSAPRPSVSRPHWQQPGPGGGPPLPAGPGVAEAESDHSRPTWLSRGAEGVRPVQPQTHPGGLCGVFPRAGGPPTRGSPLQQPHVLSRRCHAESPLQCAPSRTRQRRRIEGLSEQIQPC